VRRKFTLRALTIYTSIFVLLMVTYHALGGPTGDFVYYGAIAIGAGAMTSMIERRRMSREC
jgi:hypothetical protein